MNPERWSSTHLESPHDSLQENGQIMFNRKIGFRIIDHVCPLYIDVREGFGLEELFYTVIIGLITHKVTQETSLVIYNTSVTVNNIS